MEAFAGAVVSYGLFVMGAASRQSRMIFGRPNKIRLLAPGAFKGMHTVNPVFFTVKSGEVLEGWNATRGDERSTVVLYFSGRKENVAWSHEMASHLGSVDLWSFNYRGFGHSQGHACEINAKSDALEIYDHVVSQKSEGKKVVIIGRSLGTAMALHVAKQRKCDHLVLVTPFESVRSLVKRHPAFRPVIKLLKETFYCTEDASMVNAETSIFLARIDRVIPRKNSEKLIGSIGSEKNVDVIDVKHHNLLPRNGAMLSIIRDRLIQKGFFL